MTSSQKFLVLGAGGREHAICWHLKKYGDQVECAPGSDAISGLVETWSFEGFEDLRKKVSERGITDIIVGPEQYLADGLADFFEDSSVHVFGPSKEATQLESDKSWSKDFCSRHQIPSAKAMSVSSAEDLKEALSKFKAPYVVKAAGLAAGKGVWIGDDKEEAYSFGVKTLESHTTLVIEDFLDGIEASYFCMVDGEQSIVLGSAQDHKRLLENDEGPNTGGMGSYGPLSFVDEELEKEIQKQVVQPTIQGLKKDGIYFRGFIFFGLMVVDKIPYVLEYNCRMGDPETQSLLLRLTSAFSEMINHLKEPSPSPYAVTHRKGVSMNVVLAAKGYPLKALQGFKLNGIENPPSEIEIFHAGTKKDGETYSANGGRLFSVVCLQDTLQDCQNLLYPWIESLPFLDKISYRKDIGMKAFSAEKKEKNHA